MQLRGIGREMYDAYNAHNPDAVGALYEEHGTHRDIAMGSAKIGQIVIASGLRKFLGWFPDAHWDPLRQLVDAAGSQTITYHLNATLATKMGPITARGQRISLRGVHVLLVRDGKIHGSEDYWDAATFQKQLNNT